MEEYMSIGSRIRNMRESRGEIQEDLANLLGVTPEAVGHYERGRSKIAVTDLQKIADHYGVPLAYFLGRDTEEDRNAAQLKRLADQAESFREEIRRLADEVGELVWVPIRGTVPGGMPDFAEEIEPIETFPVPKSILASPEKAFALTVHGTSMGGIGIHDGDVVVMELELEPREGDIVLLWTYDGIVLRIFGRDKEGPYFQAGQKDYKPLRAKEGQIVAVAVYAGRHIC